MHRKQAFTAREARLIGAARSHRLILGSARCGEELGNQLLDAGLLELVDTNTLVVAPTPKGLAALETFQEEQERRGLNAAGRRLGRSKAPNLAAVSLGYRSRRGA